MYKVGDKVKIVKNTGNFHFLEIGTCATVVEDEFDGRLEVKGVSKQSGEIIRQVVRYADIEPFDPEVDKKWEIADLYNKIDMALIIGDKEMFNKYSSKLKELKVNA